MTRRPVQRDLMDAFWGFRPRRSRVVKPQLGVVDPKGEPASLAHHEPALLEPQDIPKFEPHHEIEVVVAKLEPAVTNTAEDVVVTIECMESVPKVERNTKAVPVTNTGAARQSRWRSKQDAAALRLQAKERMKFLRARRRAAAP